MFDNIFKKNQNVGLEFYKNEYRILLTVAFCFYLLWLCLMLSILYSVLEKNLVSYNERYIMLSLVIFLTILFYYKSNKGVSIKV